MTLVMIIMICVGCALIVAGLAFAGYRGFRFARAAKAAGLSSKDEVQVVIGRGRRLVPKFEEMASKQKVVAERLQSLSATTSELNYLLNQFDQATGHLFKLKK